MKRRAQSALLGIALMCCLGGIATAANAEDMRDEMREHPRIVKAIHDMEDAIKYMEAAPHDFGGYKAEAIADARRAVESLRKALRYRAHRDDERRDDDRR